jgi:hypothetical protein
MAIFVGKQKNMEDPRLTEQLLMFNLFDII